MHRTPGERLVASTMATLVFTLVFAAILITQAPAAQAEGALGSVSVSGPTQRTGVTETYTIQFTTVSAVATAGDIRVAFPAGYTVTVASLCDVTGVTGEAAVVTGQDVVCELGALGSLGASAAVTLTITNVQNPSTAQTTAAFTIQTRA